MSKWYLLILVFLMGCDSGPRVEQRETTEHYNKRVCEPACMKKFGTHSMSASFLGDCACERKD